MKGIKTRGSQIHEMKTKYNRTIKHLDGLCSFERNMCDDDEDDNDDDEPEPTKYAEHNQG